MPLTLTFTDVDTDAMPDASDTLGASYADLSHLTAWERQEILTAYQHAVLALRQIAETAHAVHEDMAVDGRIPRTVRFAQRVEEAAAHTARLNALLQASQHRAARS